MYVVVLAHGEGGTEMATLLKRDANFQCMRSSNGFLCVLLPPRSNQHGFLLWTSHVRRVHFKIDRVLHFTVIELKRDQKKRCNIFMNMCAFFLKNNNFLQFWKWECQINDKLARLLYWPTAPILCAYLHCVS